jgi:hypothetical protein
VGSLQLAFAAVHLTAGAGVWCALACLLLLWVPHHGVARLVGGVAAALLAALGVAHQDLSGLTALFGVILVTAGSPRAPASAWVPAWGLPVAAGCVGALWMVLPQVLPVQDTVVPRPLDESGPVALSLLSAGIVMALWMRRDVGRLASAGFGAAAALPLWMAASILLAGTQGTDVDVLARAARARTLGLRQHEAQLVEAAMARAEEEQRWADLHGMFNEHTHDGDAARLNVNVLRLGAHGLQAVAGPAHDVDALLQQALRRASMEDMAAFDRWPGRTQTALTALRCQARIRRQLLAGDEPPSHQGALDCYGGAWCLLGVELPPLGATVQPSIINVRWRVVAQPVGDVDTVVQLGWSGLEARGPLHAAEHLVGSEFVQAIPVDLAHPPGGELETWLRLQPVDGGKALMLEQKPGSNLVVGVMKPVSSGTSR